MFLHPRFRTLARIADGELPPGRAERTAAHLERCARCREKVRFLRSLSSVAERAPEPEPPADALEKVLARRDAGDRVILPAGDTAERAPEDRRSKIGPGLAAAALILVALGGLLLWLGPREATAGSSELRFAPARPTPEAQVSVEYRSGSFFPHADTLRFRARLRKPWDDAYNRGAVQVTVARLVRDKGDRFRGSFRLPPEVVYGVFAVEDLGGERVDDNQRRLWELLVHEADGRPLFEGLEQRIADHMGRNWDVGRETAHWMTKLYPERVEAWSKLAYFQSQSLGEVAYEELRPAHRERYLAFHDSLSLEEDLPAEQLLAMQGYWWQAGGNYDELDKELFEYWRDRVASDYPDHPTVLFRRENELQEEYRDDPDGRVTAVEPLWQRVEKQEPSSVRTDVMTAFINNTLNVAADARNPEWFRLWIERYRQYDRPTPGGVAYRVGSILDRGDLREAGLRMLRKERARLESQFGAIRSLSTTRDRQRVLNGEAAAGLLHATGRGLLAAGDTAAALDSLDLATAKAWAPDVHRLAGEVRLARGDTLGAIRNLAAVAVDPGTPESFADSALSLLGTGADLERWAVARQEARDRMTRQVLARADPKPIPGPVRLRGPDGGASSLAELAGGKPLAVVMFSRHCPWAVMALPEIERVAAWVGSRGGRVLLVSEDAPDEELDGLMVEHGVNVPPFHDFKREASRAFSNFGTPHHYVVDGDGTLMFEGAGKDQLSRIPLEVVALLEAAEGGDESGR